MRSKSNRRLRVTRKVLLVKKQTFVKSRRSLNSVINSNACDYLRIDCGSVCSSHITGLLHVYFFLAGHGGHPNSHCSVDTLTNTFSLQPTFSVLLQFKGFYFILFGIGVNFQQLEFYTLTSWKIFKIPSVLVLWVDFYLQGPDVGEMVQTMITVIRIWLPASYCAWLRIPPTGPCNTWFLASVHIFRWTRGEITQFNGIRFVQISKWYWKDINELWGAGAA